MKGLKVTHDRIQILLAEAKRGDRDAFDELLGLHRGRLEAWIRTNVGGRIRHKVEVEDLVQETYLVLVVQLAEVANLSTKTWFRKRFSFAENGFLCTIKKKQSEEEAHMRKKMNTQLEFDFQPSNLKITNEYFERYEKISEILDQNPEIVDLIHRDLKKVLKGKGKNGPGRQCTYTSDTILRILIAQVIEGEKLRGIVIRIDDSNYLRRFVRIYSGPMIDYTWLCTLKNAIGAKTWKKINRALAESAAEAELISGERLRMDTTACETNIHWPTDSSLLWDTYRVFSRLITTAREIDPEIAVNRRLNPKKVKKLNTKIARLSGKRQTESDGVRSLYYSLIHRVEAILAWMPDVCGQIRTGLAEDAYGVREAIVMEALIKQIEHFHSLGIKVVEQARRRVLEGEKVPNEEKIFSIFEPHTELLKRGKAGKPIEFGHMMVIQQVEGSFITDYEAFENKPVEHALVDAALEAHRELFGENPEEFSADKGFYESMSKIKELEQQIAVVSICKKGSRTEEELERESSPAFKLGQRFRAGVEGSISFLKRALGMFRCLNKGWKHYAATVGATVFVHNLLVLARGYG